MTTQPVTQCESEIFDGGTCVFVVHNLPSTAIEALVVRAREVTGHRIDWHYAGGRAQVLVLGDEAACSTVREHLRYLAHPTGQPWPPDGALTAPTTTG